MSGGRPEPERKLGPAAEPGPEDEPGPECRRENENEPATTYREFAPPRGLEGQLACLWAQATPAGSSPRPMLALPNGAAEIVCDLGSGTVGFLGASTRPRVARPVPGQRLVGLRFRPGAAPAALGIGAPGTTDLQVELDRLWGAEARRLGQSLAETGSTGRALAALVRSVLPRLTAGPPGVAFAAATLDRLQPWRGGSVASVSRELFLSERQFRRRALAQFGFGPKELQRILRFQAFLALVHRQPFDRVRLATLAPLLGYVDQSHLDRECLRLTRLPPRRLLHELAQTCGRTHDHAASFSGIRVRYLQDRGRRQA